MTAPGNIKVVGLGPGAGDLVTPQATAAIAGASDIVGYRTYVARIEARPGQVLHASDNREETARARMAFELAASGGNVVIVSSGDPGVFAMASAVFEVLEDGEAAWREIDVQVLPGVTSMLAAAAKIGAPLGHDFCAINLSDNLKPRELILHRITMAVRGDFAMAFFNPRSKARPGFFQDVLETLQKECGPDRPVIFARAVSTESEEIQATTLAEATADMADMRTLVIVGSSATRQIGGTKYLYTPRGAS